MELGNSLFQARKRNGFSQEDAAEKLGVSRQTISKWETGETLPDLCQAQRLACLYRMSLDNLAGFDPEKERIAQMVESTGEEIQKKIDWTKLWSKKYTVLASYQDKVSVEKYAAPLQAMLENLKKEYGYSDRDAFLVLKDILAQLWKEAE